MLYARILDFQASKILFSKRISHSLVIILCQKLIGIAWFSRFYWYCSYISVIYNDTTWISFGDWWFIIFNYELHSWITGNQDELCSFQVVCSITRFGSNLECWIIGFAWIILLIIMIFVSQWVLLESEKVNFLLWCFL